MKPKKDYTLNKQFPLTDDQNEIIEFMLSRNYCVNAAQTGLRPEKLTCLLQQQ